MRGAAGGVLANDLDPDDPLSAVLVVGPSKGGLTLNVDGSFAYRPKTNFAGTDRFTYRIEDAQGFADEATATITVAAQPG